MHRLHKIQTNNYKNINLQESLSLNALNIFIGPNGSGKSNLVALLHFLRNALITTTDEGRGITGFEDALYQLGNNRILDSTQQAPANVDIDYHFKSEDVDRYEILNLKLLVQEAHKKVIINREHLCSETDSTKEDPFYYYKSHDRFNGQGVVSIYNEPNNKTTHFETLDNIPVDTLTLNIIPELLETSQFAPEQTPVYQIRRQLVEVISQWRFYNANDMNLAQIRQAEPKIGPGDTFLASSGKNLPLVLDNLMQDLDFEERINNSMRSILPLTRRLRVIRSGRLSLTVAWNFEHTTEPFFLTEMSDGTVRMLCWATILQSPKLPPLLTIDEPEIGIHVSWLPILAEWIKQAAQRTQIIICTHSPDLLDHFTDHIDNVFVFHQDNSDKAHFQINPLSATAVASQLDEGWQLGDLYRVGDPGVGGWPW